MLVSARGFEISRVGQALGPCASTIGLSAAAAEGQCPRCTPARPRSMHACCLPAEPCSRRGNDSTNGRTSSPPLPHRYLLPSLAARGTAYGTLSLHTRASSSNSSTNGADYTPHRARRAACVLCASAVFGVSLSPANLTSPNSCPAARLLQPSPPPPPWAERRCMTHACTRLISTPLA